METSLPWFAACLPGRRQAAPSSLSRGRARAGGPASRSSLDYTEVPKLVEYTAKLCEAVWRGTPRSLRTLTPRGGAGCRCSDAACSASGVVDHVPQFLRANSSGQASQPDSSSLACLRVWYDVCELVGSSGQLPLATLLTSTPLRRPNRQPWIESCHLRPHLVSWSFPNSAAKVFCCGRSHRLLRR